MSTISDLAKAAAGRCWDGYEPVPGKDAYSDDSCRKIGSKKKKKKSEKKADDCHCYPGGPADPDKKDCKDSDCDHCDKEASAIQELAKAAASAAWQRKAGKNSKGGLNEKGRKSYERENPGSDLKAPVTGKVKPGGKAAKRRKSFCARMKGNKGPMKKPNGEPTRKALALRKWKC